MPDSGWITATGDGRQLLNGGTPIQALWVKWEFTSITNPRVRRVGTDFPNRLQYAGSAQLLTADLRYSGASDYAVAFDWVLNWEFAEYAIPTLQYGADSVDYIRWLLPLGVTVQFRVFW